MTNNMKFDKTKTIYMIGIKGVGMTMLAQFLTGAGYKVVGSDVTETYMTDKVLRRAGIKFFNGFVVDNLKLADKLIIHSSAYNPANNIEMAEAVRLKKTLLPYAEALGVAFNSYDGVAVCGSHGKTTTSAWLGYVLWKAGLEPNVLVGAAVPQFKGSALNGAGKYFVAETDEYQNKLRFYNPKMILLNNIDYDHPDFFKTKKDYNQVFADFIKKLPKSGYLIANAADKNIVKILPECRANIITYDIVDNSKADLVAHDIKQAGLNQNFRVLRHYQDLGVFKIKLAGLHSVSNALAVIAAALNLGVEIKVIQKHLATFSGTARRMQSLGKFNGAEIIDDYAHHPTEVKTTLNGIAKLYPTKNIITVFHPHTFTRTKALINDFAGAFADTKELIVLDIYGSAREKQGGVTSAELVTKIKEFNKYNKIKQNVLHIAKLEEVEKYLKENLSAKDLLVLMGAGDVFRVAEGLLKK